MNLLPWMATLAMAGATLAGILQLRGHDAGAWQKRLLWLATALAGLTLLVLLWLFLVVDVSYQYVFLYTSLDVPLRYRVAGVWAGREGSLALWAFWSAAVAAWASRRWSGRVSQITLVGTSALATLFLLAAARADVFAATSEFFIQQRPGGNGLNPTLQSDFFLIHPPMMFLAYALTNIPAAAALGHVMTGHNQWSHARPLAQWNWLWYTAAMGLGGVWAYYTLGFGGYWAWDPVEVANLLPWLALTLFLHAQLHHQKHGRYQAVGPFLAMLPFLLTLFSTISTRSGLWVSVHAFTDPTQTFNPDAVGRFQDILEVEPSLAFYVGLLLATFLLFLGLWARRLSIEHNVLRTPMKLVAALLAGIAAWAALSPATAYGALAEAGNTLLAGRAATGLLVLACLAVALAALPAWLKQDEGKLRLDVSGLNYAAVLILGLGLLVLWLWHMVAANGWSTAFYEERLPWMALPAIIALTVFMALPFGKRRALQFAAGNLVLAVVAALVWQPWVGYLAASCVFLLFAAERTRRAATAKMPRRVAVGRAVLALGALANLIFWLNPPHWILGARLTWPIQLLAVPAAWLLLRCFAHMAGQHEGMRTTRIGVAVLGGFFIAPVAALASHLLERTPDLTRLQPARAKQIGLYLIHFALAVAFVGYGTSTYLGNEAEIQLDQEGAASFAGATLQLGNGTASGWPVDTYQPVLDVDGQEIPMTLRWQPTTGSYYPEPGTLRWWHGDLFVSIDSACTTDCNAGKVTAYEPTQQRLAPEVTEVQLTIHHLPGLGLVWAALALFVLGCWMLTHSGIPLSMSESREKQ